LFRAKPGQKTADRQTGKIRPFKHEPDAGLHFEGDGEAAWGTKFVLVAARTEDERGRLVLDIDWVPKPGGEAAVAMECFTRLAPLVEGAQRIVYDTALRGVHHQRILREFGLLSISRVTAAEAAPSSPGARTADVRRRASTWRTRWSVGRMARPPVSVSTQREARSGSVS